MLIFATLISFLTCGQIGAESIAIAPTFLKNNNTIVSKKITPKKTYCADFYRLPGIKNPSLSIYNPDKQPSSTSYYW